MKKISILHENMHTCKADDYYRDVIVQPTTRKVSVAWYIFTLLKNSLVIVTQIHILLCCSVLLDRIYIEKGFF